MPCGLENTLDAQHLLHLVLHGHPVLEIERGIRADGDLAVLLVRHDFGAEPGPKLGVFLERIEIVARQLFHGVTLAKLTGNLIHH